jgi:aryl-alcohol dehydrogenase-like predicted oxidoreductase
MSRRCSYTRFLTDPPRESESDVFPGARYNNVGLLAWSPLADGFLTGKYSRDDNPASSTRAGSDNPVYHFTAGYRAADPQTWDVVDAVRKAAEQVGASPARVALSWLHDRPGMVAPIIGARNVDQLRDNLAAADLHLDDTIRQALDDVSAPRVGQYPYGPFGAAQRARTTEGGTPLAAVIEAAQ